MSNICLHRMSVLLEGTGSPSRIICPYHGWICNLNGSLRAAPAITQEPNFCKSDYMLPTIRCEQWMNWIYITLNPELKSVHERLSELEDLIAHFEVDKYTQTFHETRAWDTNWKVLHAGPSGTPWQWTRVS